MRLNFISMACMGVCIFCFISFSAAARDTNPKIIIPEPRYHFGAVVEGKTVVHEFIVLNKGTAPLNIEKVKTG